jgi:hypothetical protein
LLRNGLVHSCEDLTDRADDQSLVIGGPGRYHYVTNLSAYGPPVASTSLQVVGSDQPGKGQGHFALHHMALPWEGPVASARTASTVAGDIATLARSAAVAAGGTAGLTICWMVQA